MRIAIVDDDITQLKHIAGLTSEITGVEYEKISLFTSSEEFLFYYSPGLYDLLLLDIQMNGDNGIVLAKKIREQNDNVSVIFITAVSDYVFSGYDVGAKQYLLKPVNKAKLKECIDKLKEERADGVKIFFNNSDGGLAISSRDILYLEAVAHNTEIVCKNGVITAADSISECEKKLTDRFVKAHRSYIINLEYISSIKKYNAVLDNGGCVPISRRLYSEVNRRFIDFYRRKT